MKSKLSRILIGLLLFIMTIPIIQPLETVTASQCKVEESNYDTGTNHIFIDAFIFGIIQQYKGSGQYGIFYINATLVYTTEFHRFYTGWMEIGGFRGVLTQSFICGFYNDGW